MGVGAGLGVRAEAGLGVFVRVGAGLGVRAGGGRWLEVRSAAVAKAMPAAALMAKGSAVSDSCLIRVGVRGRVRVRDRAGLGLE